MNEHTNAVPADVSGALFGYRHADAAEAVQRRAEIDAAILAYGDQRAREAAEQMREQCEQIARQRTANACASASYRYAWHDAQVDIACAIHTAPLPGGSHA